MSDPTDPRAAEIIAAYGADPARWPHDERATVAAALATSAELRAAQAAAAMLDADLVGWATMPVTPGDPARAAAAALVGARSTVPSRSYLRWLGGTGVAAAVAATLVVVVPTKRVAPAASTAVAGTTATPGGQAATTDDVDAFAQVFTPTPDEEQTL